MAKNADSKCVYCFATNRVTQWGLFYWRIFHFVGVLHHKNDKPKLHKLLNYEALFKRQLMRYRIDIEEICSCSIFLISSIA